LHEKKRKPYWNVQEVSQLKRRINDKKKDEKIIEKETKN
jgi:hypothetical protein